MTRHPPSCLDTSLNPEVQKLLEGGVENGPKIRPASHFFSTVSMTSGC